MPITDVERRLTAILAADVAGYSRLVGADVEGTLAQWKAHWDSLIEPKAREHRGRIVRVLGDSILIEFGSVIDAVRCAIEVSEAWRSATQTYRWTGGSNFAWALISVS